MRELEGLRELQLQLEIEHLLLVRVDHLDGGLQLARPREQREDSKGSMEGGVGRHHPAAEEL